LLERKEKDGQLLETKLTIQHDNMASIEGWGDMGYKEILLGGTILIIGGVLGNETNKKISSR